MFIGKRRSFTIGLTIDSKTVKAKATSNKVLKPWENSRALIKELTIDSEIRIMNQFLRYFFISSILTA
jgi:hypothetical protein